MKITIRRQYDIGTCCGDERLIWMTEEVTPQELKRLIDRCENIRVINNPYKEQVMKAYTDLNQSKVLAYILSHDTADQTYERVAICGENLDVPEEMQYRHNGDMPFQFYSGIGVPCWSLAALLDVLPVEVEIHRQTDEHKIYYYYVESYMKRMRKEIYLSTERHESLIDACYEMILKLKEKNLL